MIEWTQVKMNVRVGSTIPTVLNVVLPCVVIRPNAQKHPPKTRLYFEDFRKGAFPHIIREMVNYPKETIKKTQVYLAVDIYDFCHT